VEPGQDRKAGLDQRYKLLIENNEFFGLDFGAALKKIKSENAVIVPDGVHEVPLLNEAIPDLLVGKAGFDPLEHVAALICQFDQEFSHYVVECGRGGVLLLYKV